MEEESLDYVLVPVGLAMLLIYHIWLLLTILHRPTQTVVGLNAQSRRQWVYSLMSDPLKNGVLAVQTIRNNIMASTLLATTAITLTSLISVFVSSVSSSANSASDKLIYGNKSAILSSVKYFSILICFLIAFVCNVQSIRYYAHVSFLVTLPTSAGHAETIDYVARNLNRGSHFWSFGLRAFYVSFPLFLWIFGPIPMIVCSCVMVVMLYFLDTTSSFTRRMHTKSMKRAGPNVASDDDEESVAKSP